jgi:hypothetical protein
MHYFNTEHLPEETRRKMARRLEESRKYNGKDGFEYHRYEIEKGIFEARGDFSVRGCTDESGRSLDVGCDRF